MKFVNGYTGNGIAVHFKEGSKQPTLWIINKNHERMIGFFRSIGDAMEFTNYLQQLMGVKSYGRSSWRED